MGFSLLNVDADSKARLGLISTKSGDIETPVFMPVCTKGTPKAITTSNLQSMGFNMVVANAYHLFLKPGHVKIKEYGGLHSFMDWKDVILTDSGGFQVYSLSPSVKISEDGVSFKSYIDGTNNFISPELSIEIQEYLGSDIMMIFDDCPKPDSEYSKIQESIKRTKEWAFRCKKAKKSDAELFGIIQGGIYDDLRSKSLNDMIDIGFDGYAIGGLGLGEGISKTYEITNQICSLLPEDKPRYSMGIGKPEDIISSVELGVDIFDCVVPTRNARNGTLYTKNGKINIKNSIYEMSDKFIDEEDKNHPCYGYTLGYIKHLFTSKEISALLLMTMNNLYFYKQLIESIKKSIKDGNFINFKKTFLKRYKNESS